MFSPIFDEKKIATLFYGCEGLSHFTALPIERKKEELS